MTTMASFCEACGNVPRGATICVGCHNEMSGLCRWCGERAPAGESDLCARCEEAGDIAVEVGTFSGALAVLDMRSELAALPDGCAPKTST